MNIREASLLERVKRNLTELVEITAKGHCIGHSRKLTANVSSRAKWLQKAIADLEANIIPPPKDHTN